MSLSDIININIVASAAGVSKTNFGTPLIAAYHTVGAGGAKVRSYRSLPALEADFAVGTLVHDIATVMFSQKRRPKIIKVGRRATAWTQLVHLIPTVTTPGFVYTFEIDGIEVTYTNGGSETVATVCDGILAAINLAIADVTATDGTTHVICTADAAGAFHTYTREDRLHDALKFSNKTTDASAIATDLAAFSAEDDDWYGVYVDTQSELVLNAAAAWIESREKVMFANPSDYDIGDTVVTTDLASDMKGLNYVRTFLCYHPDIGNHLMAGLMAERFTRDPGSDTYAFKTVVGARVYKVSDTFQTGLESKNVSWYQTLAGRDVTFPMLVPSGDVFADFVRGRDWTAARMRERFFGLLVTNEKLGYENDTADLFRSELNAQLEEAADRKFLTRDTPFVINVPDATDQLQADREARHYPGIEWTAQAAGAVHTIDINGSITF